MSEMTCNRGHLIPLGDMFCVICRKQGYGGKIMFMDGQSNEELRGEVREDCRGDGEEA